MTTKINITIESGGLTDKVKQQQQASRQAQLEKERQQRIETEGTDQRTAKLKAEGKAPDGSPLNGLKFKQPQIDRRPAANRFGEAYFLFKPDAEPTKIGNNYVWPFSSKNLNLPITLQEDVRQYDDEAYFDDTDNAFVLSRQSLIDNSTGNWRIPINSNTAIRSNITRSTRWRARSVKVEAELRHGGPSTSIPGSDSGSVARIYVSDYVTMQNSSVSVNGSPAYAAWSIDAAGDSVLTLLDTSTESTFIKFSAEYVYPDKVTLSIDEETLTITVNPADIDQLFESGLDIRLIGQLSMGASDDPPDPVVYLPSGEPAIRNLKITWRL